MLLSIWVVEPCRDPVESDPSSLWVPAMKFLRLLLLLIVPSALMGTEITFLGGYSLDQRTVVILQIDSQSHWLKVGQSRHGITVVAAAADLSFVDIESAEGIQRLSIATPKVSEAAREPAPEPQVSMIWGDEADFSPAQEEAILATIDDIINPKSATDIRVRELLAGRLPVSAEERREIEAIEAKNGYSVTWELGENGEVLSFGKTLQPKANQPHLQFIVEAAEKLAAEFKEEPEKLIAELMEERETQP